MSDLVINNSNYPSNEKDRIKVNRTLKEK